MIETIIQRTKKNTEKKRENFSLSATKRNSKGPFLSKKLSTKNFPPGELSIFFHTLFTFKKRSPFFTKLKNFSIKEPEVSSLTKTT